MPIADAFNQTDGSDLGLDLKVSTKALLDLKRES
jgi:hypothetical protein